MKALRLRPVTYNRRCHFSGKLIPPGKEAICVTEGEAQGIYYNMDMYRLALKHYRALKQEQTDE